MAFQSTVNRYNTIGVVGALALAGPLRAAEYELISDPNPNVIGRAFTVTDGANPNPVYNVPGGSTLGSPIAGVARAGGTGVFAGILSNPKEQVLTGSTGNPLAPTLTLPDHTLGSLVTMGFLYITLPAVAAEVGDLVYYDNTTGVLGTVAPLARGTGVIATTTLTISGFVAGSAPFAVGQLVKGANVAPGTYITGLGTGVGGDGTYTITPSQTAGSAAVTAAAVAPSGKTFVPGGTIYRFDIAAAGGLAILQLTN